MQVSNSIFSDPSMRSGLEKYYENKKSELIETLKERDSERFHLLMKTVKP